MEKRFCCICCEDKDLSNFYFVANKDGLSYQCKECLKEYRRRRNITREYYKRYYYKKKGVNYNPILKRDTPSKVFSEKKEEGVGQNTISYSVSFE
jgi:hypothetical protein